MNFSHTPVTDPPPPSGRGRTPYKILCSDGTGFIRLIFFRARQDWLEKQLPEVPHHAAGPGVGAATAIPRVDVGWPVSGAFLPAHSSPGELLVRLKNHKANEKECVKTPQRIII